MNYRDYILNADVEIVREIQADCAQMLENDWHWTTKDAERIAALLNQSTNPIDLFRFMDEKTGSSYVGYRTQDGREWFPILRQMRNGGSGLLENLRRAKICTCQMMSRNVKDCELHGHRFTD